MAQRLPLALTTQPPIATMITANRTNLSIPASEPTNHWVSVIPPKTASAAIRTTAGKGKLLALADLFMFPAYFNEARGARCARRGVRRARNQNQFPITSVGNWSRVSEYPSNAELRGIDNTMSVIVRVPATLRALTAGESEISVEGDTVAAVLDSLESSHPGFKERILDDAGELRRFVNLFVSDDDVRFLDGISTEMAPGETLSIVPAVAGG